MCPKTWLVFLRTIEVRKSFLMGSHYCYSNKKKLCSTFLASNSQQKKVFLYLFKFIWITFDFTVEKFFKLKNTGAYYIGFCRYLPTTRAKTEFLISLMSRSVCLSWTMSSVRVWGRLIQLEPYFKSVIQPKIIIFSYTRKNC